MRTMITAIRTIHFLFTCVILLLTIRLSHACAHSGDYFGFLLRFNPKVSKSMIVTGPEHVEHVIKHSLVFSPNQARKVLPELDRILTKPHGWTREVTTSGEYVTYKRGKMHVSYMSDRVYRHLTWPHGTKHLPTKKSGCVVEYFNINN